jgi:FkbM family methyltransferase
VRIKSLIVWKIEQLLSGRTLAWFLNFQQSKNVVSFEFRNGIFEVSDNDAKVHRTISPRTKHYKQGLKHRGDDLAKSYALDEVPLSPGDLVIDVGANTGDLLLWLPADIVYIGFEPSASEFECLSLNFSSRAGSVHRKAVSNFAGVSQFYISSEGADSSLVEPLMVEATSVVETVTLDDFVDGKICRLLKIDAEGAEYEVLLGLNEKVRNISYIAVDCGFEKGIREESTLVEVINYLVSNDFSLISVGHKTHRYLFKNQSAELD